LVGLTKRRVGGERASAISTQQKGIEIRQSSTRPRLVVWMNKNDIRTEKSTSFTVSGLGKKKIGEDTYGGGYKARSNIAHDTRKRRSGNQSWKRKEVRKCGFRKVTRLHRNQGEEGGMTEVLGHGRRRTAGVKKAVMVRVLGPDQKTGAKDPTTAGGLGGLKIQKFLRGKGGKMSPKSNPRLARGKRRREDILKLSRGTTAGAGETAPTCRNMAARKVGRSPGKRWGRLKCRWDARTATDPTERDDWIEN